MVPLELFTAPKGSAAARLRTTELDRMGYKCIQVHHSTSVCLYVCLSVHVCYRESVREFEMAHKKIEGVFGPSTLHAQKEASAMQEQSSQHFNFLLKHIFY